MKFEVYGPGCPKCQNAAEVIKQTLAEMNVSAEVEKVSDLDAMLDKGILKTPAVYLDGKKLLEGKVPTKDDVKAWLNK
ncbi:MAG: thioredoxin family protein [Firmicutes bacterium]|nr:thioredoxin family protein [Bacillota bacterium]